MGTSFTADFLYSKLGNVLFLEGGPYTAFWLVSHEDRSTDQ